MLLQLLSYYFDDVQRNDYFSYIPKIHLLSLYSLNLEYFGFYKAIFELSVFFNPFKETIIF